MDSKVHGVAKKSNATDTFTFSKYLQNGQPCPKLFPHNDESRDVSIPTQDLSIHYGKILNCTFWKTIITVFYNYNSMNSIQSLNFLSKGMINYASIKIYLLRNNIIWKTVQFTIKEINLKELVNLVDQISTRKDLKIFNKP